MQPQGSHTQGSIAIDLEYSNQPRRSPKDAALNWYHFGFVATSRGAAEGDGQRGAQRNISSTHSQDEGVSTGIPYFLSLALLRLSVCTCGQPALSTDTSSPGDETSNQTSVGRGGKADSYLGASAQY